MDSETPRFELVSPIDSETKARINHIGGYLRHIHETTGREHITLRLYFDLIRGYQGLIEACAAFPPGELERNPRELIPDLHAAIDAAEQLMR